jgi:hypothetical protein
MKVSDLTPEEREEVIRRKTLSEAEVMAIIQEGREVI